MNKITPAQVRAIELAHADGLLDFAISQRAGVSIPTVKRYRTKLGLVTNCVTTLRGREGEQRVRAAALLLGLNVIWRKRDNARHDLTVAGLRVDVKAAMQEIDGSWRFPLPRVRSSNMGRYSYDKHYEKDCELIALVCLRADGGEPSMYFLDSRNLPADVRVRSGLTYQEALEAWHLFSPLIGAGLAA